MFSFRTTVKDGTKFDSWYGDHWGNYITKYVDSDKLWCFNITVYTEPNVLEKYGYSSHGITPTDELSFTVPSAGFITAFVRGWSEDAKNLADSPVKDGKKHPSEGCSLYIYINGVCVFQQTSSNFALNAVMPITPVSKGDIIRYGTLYDWDIPPEQYFISFIPAKDIGD